MTIFRPLNKGEAPDPAQTIKGPKYGSPKLDGIRASMQEGTVLTYSHKPIPNLALRRRWEDRPQWQGIEGEFLYGDPAAPDVYSRTYSAVMTINGSADDINFYTFDCLDLNRSFEHRYSLLRDRVTCELGPESIVDVMQEDILLLRQRLLVTPEEIDAHYPEMLDRGYEGDVLRNRDAMYKMGRSTVKSQDLLKRKPHLDTEGVILDYYEAMHNGNEAFINELGRTERSTHQENLVGKGMIGGFWAEWEGVRFKVSAGKMTHTERIYWWEHRTELPGMLFTYRHMDYGRKDAPRMGRWIKWRSQLDL